MDRRVVHSLVSYHKPFDGEITKALQNCYGVYFVLWDVWCGLGYPEVSFEGIGVCLVLRQDGVVALLGRHTILARGESFSATISTSAPLRPVLGSGSVDRREPTCQLAPCACDGDGSRSRDDGEHCRTEIRALPRGGTYRHSERALDNLVRFWCKTAGWCTIS